MCADSIRVLGPEMAPAESTSELESPGRVTPIGRTLATAFLSRTTSGALGLVLVLFGLENDLGYALSGAIAGVYALGSAIGGPLLARWADRRGMTLPLVSSTIASTMAGAALALSSSSSLVGIVVLALLLGLTQPPVAACARSLWSTQLDPIRLTRVLTIDSIMQGLGFILGPILLVSLATSQGSQRAILVAVASSMTFTVAFAAVPAVRTAPTHPRPHPRGPRLGAPVWLLLVIAGLMGAGMGILEVSVIAQGGEIGTPKLVGVYYGTWAAGSLIGGLITLRRHHNGGGTVARMLRFLVLLALTNATLVFGNTFIGLSLALLIAGLPATPVFASHYELLGRFAPLGRTTEVFAWGATSSLVGVAIGNAVAGSVVDAWGPREGILAASALFMAAAIVGRLGARALQQPTTANPPMTVTVDGAR